MGTTWRGARNICVFINLELLPCAMDGRVAAMWCDGADAQKMETTADSNRGSSNQAHQFSIPYPDRGRFRPQNDGSPQLPRHANTHHRSPAHKRKMEYWYSCESNTIHVTHRRLHSTLFEYLRTSDAHVYYVHAKKVGQATRFIHTYTYAIWKETTGIELDHRCCCWYSLFISLSHSTFNVLELFVCLQCYRSITFFSNLVVIEIERYSNFPKYKAMNGGRCRRMRDEREKIKLM